LLGDQGLLHAAENGLCSVVQFLYIPSPITNGLQVVRFQVGLDFLK